jgi:hypothetical protein
MLHIWSCKWKNKGQMQGDSILQQNLAHYLENSHTILGFYSKQNPDSRAEGPFTSYEIAWVR